MRIRLALALPWFLLASMPAGAAETETILFIRHGEKPPGGLGQISCQGLNRALALPAVLKRKYGRIDAVYAPNPAEQKPDGQDADGDALRYDYLRPLATIEPTAIAYGLPVHAQFGYAEIGKLRDALQAPAYRQATVVVAWEHHALNDMVPAMLKALGGDPAQVTKMEKRDFDLIWRLTIRRDGAATTAAFTADRQGLDGLPDVCPTGIAAP